MAELLHNLHIEWPLILAQAVNFFVLLIVLTKLVYKPLIARLNQRREAIAESLEKAEAIEKRLEEFRSYQQEQLTRTHAEAQKIIESAQKQGENEKQESLIKAKQDIEQLVSRAKGEIQQEKDAMLRSAQREMAELLIPALEKVLEKNIDGAAHDALLARAQSTIQKNYPRSS